MLQSRRGTSHSLRPRSTATVAAQKHTRRMPGAPTRVHDARSPHPKGRPSPPSTLILPSSPWPGLPGNDSGGRTSCVASSRSTSSRVRIAEAACSSSLRSSSRASSRPYSAVWDAPRDLHPWPQRARSDSPSCRSSTLSRETIVGSSPAARAAGPMRAASQSCAVGHRTRSTPAALAHHPLEGPAPGGPRTTRSDGKANVRARKTLLNYLSPSRSRGGGSASDSGERPSARRNRGPWPPATTGACSRGSREGRRELRHL